MVLRSLPLSLVFVAFITSCSPMNPSLPKDLIIEPVAIESSDGISRLSIEEVESPQSQQKISDLLVSRSVRGASARHWMSEHQFYGRKSLQGRSVPEDYRLYRVSVVLLENGSYELLIQVGAEMNRVRSTYRDKGKWHLQGDKRVLLESTGARGISLRAAIGINDDNSAALFLRFQEDLEINIGGELQVVQLTERVVPLRYTPGKLDENL
jgi:hypothetical protein